MRVAPVADCPDILASAVGSATAQFARDDRYPAATGTIPPPASQAAAGPAGMSGLRAASGHPLMTAEAIRAAAANFPALYRASVAACARRNISRGVFQTYGGSLTPDLRIMICSTTSRSSKIGLDISNPGHRTNAPKGRELLKNIARLFEAVERTTAWNASSSPRSGASRPLRRLGGDRSVLRSTATLACIAGAELFPRRFLAALESSSAATSSRPAGRFMAGVRADPVHAVGVQGNAVDSIATPP